MSIRNCLLLTVLCFASIATPAAEHAKNTSYQTAWGERVLRHEAMVTAPVQQVWEAFTTAEGLKTFVAPNIELERRTGGKFHSNYRYGSKVGDPGTIYNTVLSYVPLRMFSFRIGLTGIFPKEARDAGTLFCVLEFEPVASARTKVSVSMVGWGDGPDWDWTWKFFDQGNAYTLDQLYLRFEKGPVDWKNRAAPKVHTDPPAAASDSPKEKSE